MSYGMINFHRIFDNILNWLFYELIAKNKIYRPLSDTSGWVNSTKPAKQRIMGNK